MPTLNPSHRDQLATVIGKENTEGGARAVATAGARAAIEALAVHRSAPHAHLDAAERQLRNRLRARARQLNDTQVQAQTSQLDDTRHGNGRHEIGRLVEQTAYEHWHRMLFARFLAENELLIHPQMNVAVTLEECEELAPTEGAADAWELAGRYASRMLPQIFRPDDPALAVTLAAEHQRELERLLASLPSELFRASDSLGWCYQFWQARKKKEVNASEVKIGADELPAVTQLFTEPYMVQFLLHNTLGAWWAGAGRELLVDMPYLRFLDDGTPAAGTFDGWPRLARELKVLDPCCGSGHFLVAAFEILVSFRMAEEGLNAREACDAVLRDNLFGLEIDYRCVQLAAFALALAAWTYPAAGGYRPLASMNVACSGLAVAAKKEEWERLGGDNQRLEKGMGRMWELFGDAPVLGSLIDPTRDPPDPMFTAGIEEIRPLLTRAIVQEADGKMDEREVVVSASGIAEAAKLLDGRYSLISTNVPYLTGKRFGETLRTYARTHFADSWYDLSTTFLYRLLGLLKVGGTCAVVVPQNWTMLTSYAAFRRQLLTTHILNWMASLGEEAWVTFGSRGPRAVLLSLSAGRPESEHRFAGFDLSEFPSIEEKIRQLKTLKPLHLEQSSSLANPDHRIVLDHVSKFPTLTRFAISMRGIVSGDGDRFTRKFWEMPLVGRGWLKLQSSPKPGGIWSGRDSVIDWSRQGEGMLRPGTTNEAYGKVGVAVAQLRSLHATPYTGELYDNNTGVIVPHDPSLVPAIYAFVSSPKYRAEIRKIDQKKNVTNATLIKVPFDEGHWTSVAARAFPDGLPAPRSEEPHQWLFLGHPRISQAPLQVTVARLLGYRWPDQQPDALDSHADADGIVCIPAIRGELSAADRLASMLAMAWGKDWHPQTSTDLLAAVGNKSDLEEWLRDSFFKQHCELFHHRPFIWHVWDGHREGFSALVNYHKLDHEGLKSLTYTYLGDWIRTQEIEAKAGKSGAGDKLVKAKALQQRLAAILEGEAPYDIFVRWKPIEQQPIGWRPDLDDGVRLNIRPFMTASPMCTDGPKAGQGAGVLRYKPNIKWGKDRGKNPPGSPWGEIRDNDKHLTLAEKRAAREEC